MTSVLATIAALPHTSSRRLDAANESNPAAPRATIAALTPERHAAEVVAAKAVAIAERARLRREAIRAVVLATLPPLLGFALFVGAWALFAQANGSLPSPIKANSVSSASTSVIFTVSVPAPPSIWMVFAAVTASISR